MEDEPEGETQPMPDPAIEIQGNEEILPEDEASDEGTIHANSDSELTFAMPETDDIPKSDRVLSPRTLLTTLKSRIPTSFNCFVSVLHIA